MFLILVEGGHNHGESRRVTTNNKGFPTGKHEPLELCLEVERWGLLTKAKKFLDTLAKSWSSLITKNSYTPQLYLYSLHIT